MKLVFATHNHNKLREIQLLVPKHIKVVSLHEIGCTVPIPETADTLEGNAKLKADFVFKNYNFPCFADDTGLIVNALNGSPGVYSARYAGEANDANANMDKLLKNLNGLKDRSASFKTVIALRLSEKVQFFEGSVDGEICTEKREPMASVMILFFNHRAILKHSPNFPFLSRMKLDIGGKLLLN